MIIMAFGAKVLNNLVSGPSGIGALEPDVGAKHSSTLV